MQAAGTVQVMKPPERVMADIKSGRILGHLSTAAFDGTVGTTHPTEHTVRRLRGLMELITADADRGIIHMHLPMPKRTLSQRAVAFAEVVK